MYLSVKEVKAIDNYILILTFENDEIRIFDMKKYLDKGIFKELKNRDMFNSVKVKFDSIEWSNLADIDPETLYDESVPYIN